MLQSLLLPLRSPNVAHPIQVDLLLYCVLAFVSVIVYGKESQESSHINQLICVYGEYQGWVIVSIVVGLTFWASVVRILPYRIP